MACDLAVYTAHAAHGRHSGLRGAHNDLEQLAARQRLSDAYRAQLLDVRDRFEKKVVSAISQLQQPTTTDVTPPQQFARAVNAGLCDALIVGDEQRTPLYPSLSESVATQTSRIPPDLAVPWRTAENLEFRSQDLAAAVAAFDGILTSSTDPIVQAEAYQGKVRCLLKLHDLAAANRELKAWSARSEPLAAFDADGRWIFAGAQLLWLEQASQEAELPHVTEVRREFESRLRDYDAVPMPAVQRRFLMKQYLSMPWQDTARDVASTRDTASQRDIASTRHTASVFPTLAGEDLAAAWLAAPSRTMAANTLSHSSLEGVWQLPASVSGTVLLFRQETLKRWFRQSLPTRVSARFHRWQLDPQRHSAVTIGTGRGQSIR